MVEVITEDTAPSNLSSRDSFDKVWLVIALEETYGVTLMTGDIEAMSSVRTVKDVLRKKGIAVWSTLFNSLPFIAFFVRYAFVFRGRDAKLWSIYAADIYECS